MTAWHKDKVKNFLQDEYNVSRETCDKLDIYADLLEKWQNSINLVSNSTLASLW